MGVQGKEESQKGFGAGLCSSLRRRVLLQGEKAHPVFLPLTVKFSLRKNKKQKICPESQNINSNEFNYYVHDEIILVHHIFWVGKH